MTDKQKNIILLIAERYNLCDYANYRRTVLKKELNQIMLDAGIHKLKITPQAATPGAPYYIEIMITL